jgi:hypothetical protein
MAAPTQETGFCATKNSIVVNLSSGFYVKLCGESTILLVVKKLA